MSEHLAESAELYAVGALEDRERREVEKHVSRCVPCALRLSQAQETVAALAAAQPQHEPPERLHGRLRESVESKRSTVAHHWWPVGFALAAAFALALIPTWVAVDRSRLAVQNMRQDERALARIAAAPAFDRSVFMSPRRRPMNAKVLYGPGGDWYYVVVMHPASDMQVAYVHDGRMEMLGAIAVHGESGTLYLPIRHKMERLALLRGHTVVADARLVY